jgi:hypothetical protein
MSKKIKALFGIFTLFSAVSLSADAQDVEGAFNNDQEGEISDAIVEDALEIPETTVASIVAAVKRGRVKRGVCCGVCVGGCKVSVKSKKHSKVKRSFKTHPKGTPVA